jgi:catechol 2,3-dioxygenase-like lactoylglutathione lyase family enzyme
MSDATTGTWARGISALTIFAEDLAAMRAFYGEVVGARLVMSDSESAAYAVGSVIVNVLRVESAGELIEPAPVGPAGTPTRIMPTIDVDDVDAVCERLRSAGVALLNGPMDRPWGVRTAAFQDPAGHVWEIAQPMRRG